MEGLDARVSALETWRQLNEPMLKQLAEDQAYRARWREERAKRWSRWQRGFAFAFSAVGALAVVAAAVVQLSHLL
jgi:hypothetical protein